MPDIKFSNKYPYTDFHELNLDWVIKEVKYWSTKVGKTIQSIELTGTAGLVDTYTINYSDGTTSTFDVTNGNGIASIEKTETAGLVDTYTITFQDSSTTEFYVRNGAEAVDPTLTLSDYAADAKATGDAIATKVSKDILQSANLFDKNNIVTDEYLNSNSVIPAAGYAHTSWIFVTAGDYLATGYAATYGANATLIQYSTDGNTVAGSFNAVFFPGSTTMKFTATADYYIRFNLRLGSIDTEMLVAGSLESDYPTTYVPYSRRVQIEAGVGFNDKMKSEIILVSPLWQKMISADGDSICYGNGYVGGYAKIISDKYDMRYENLAVAGGTITADTYSGSYPRHWICRSMSSISSNADYILIEGGVNDSSLGVPLGVITTGWWETLDDTTFYGALETIFKTLTTQYVGKKYCFIIPHRMGYGMAIGGAYYNAIMECATKWGVPVLDLTRSVPPFNQFRNDATLDAVRNTYTVGGDGWHPTEICYREYYAPQIESFLLTL